MFIRVTILTMKIQLVKYGTILSSRPAGKEAYLAFKAYVLTDKQKSIEIDFSGVKVLSPSWADEFFTPLKKEYAKRLIFLPSDNPSVLASLKMIKISGGGGSR